MHVSLENHTEDDVKHFDTRIRKIENVLECHLMTGISDYLLKVAVEDLASYKNFVRKHLHPIGGLASIDTSFA